MISDLLNFDEDSWLDDKEDSGQQKRVTTNSPRSEWIQLNPYISSPEKALTAIGRICSAKPSDYMKKWASEINDILFKDSKENNDESGRSSKIQLDLNKYFFSQRNFFFNKDFIYHLKKLLKDLLLGMDGQMHRPSSKAILVSVGGTFNAGKSTLLNYILGYKDLLPTEQTAATMIPAFLHCGNFVDNITVSGVNVLNALVPLDTEILNCVSHSTKDETNTANQIATALQHFIVQINNTNFKDYIFIDTPGYDNIEEESSRLSTDEMIADKYLPMGDIILWLVPTTDGAFNKDNIERLRKLSGINQFESSGDDVNNKNPKLKKIIIALTKADYRDRESRTEIFEQVCQRVEDMPNVVDVIQLSAYNDQRWKECWHSRSGNDLKTILDNASSEILGLYETHAIILKIIKLFDYELTTSETKFKEYQQLQEKARVNYTNALRKINSTRIKQENFFNVHSDIDKEVKQVIEVQFKGELDAIHNEYNHEQNIESTNVELNKQTRKHHDYLKRWKLNLLKWFRSQPILHYSESSNKEVRNAGNTLRVYFKASKKLKRVNARIHYWSDDFSTDWPGIAMTYVTREEGNNIWMYDIPAWAKGMVFAIVAEDDTIHSQSMDFVGDDIKDGFVYYRTKIDGKYKRHKSSPNPTEVLNSMAEEEFVQAIHPGTLRKRINMDEVFKSIENLDYNGLLENLNCSCDITEDYNEDGMSVVTAAAHFGFQKALDLLVRFKGTEILNIADNRGYNALHSAAAALKFETCELILNMDTKLSEITTIDGRTYRDLVPAKYQILMN